MSEPLTAAQVEMVQQYIAARREEMEMDLRAQLHAALDPLHAQVQALTQQVATLQETVTVLDGAAIKAGNRVALAGASGLVVGAYGGGPVKDGDPFLLVGRIAVGEWESFVVQRGVV